MGVYRIKMNGKVYEMEVELVGVSTPKAEMETSKVTANPSLESKKTNTYNEVQMNSNIVVAPMPGTVVQILANVGDEVDENEAILILEAMKMENEIYASKVGKVKKIYVSVGQAVTSGSPLFEMED